MGIARDPRLRSDDEYTDSAPVGMIGRGSVLSGDCYFDRGQMAAIRKELDEECEANIGTHISSKDGPVVKKSSKMRT
jgi:hypothetical protein